MRGEEPRSKKRQIERPGTEVQTAYNRNLRRRPQVQRDF
jgi:hypothetical protein